MRPLEPTERELLVVKLKLVSVNASLAASAASLNNEQALEKYLYDVESDLEIARRIVPRPPQLGSGR